MSAGLQGYLEELRRTLRPALCLHNFPSQRVEGHNHPEIEVHTSPELLLPPVTVTRSGGSGGECALVEQSVNSTRVSFRFKAADAMEEYLMRTYLKFLMHRADQLQIVRRVPLPGYDVTFLVTSFHLDTFNRDKLVDFILKFVEDLYAEISAQKLALRSRSRAVVQEYWQLLERRHSTQQTQQHGEKAGGGTVAAD